MPVINPSIDQIKDIPRNHRRKRHAAPVLAQAGNPKGLCDEGGIDAKEEAVREAGEAGNKTKEVGVLDAGAADLGAAEDDGGGKEAPEAGHGEFFNDQVGADA